ncbi:hypothetical protein K437DRAFT_254630 [Tilletiaria anomala UBC 951]|uniref:Signal recognition particle receptor subunit beta n=1 Tax=Tilletiaria anomala (strain ATCC 24038 / CBS 436.72 / UBC 951) TaxID=1037660 RepID=A0A066WE74_TILAU|nr:uncharacterized protein K437DRAFT_254630 [Tilletiaria anomala UBC 951]KDN52076.1 hypothetical protein K437DRAFT_254630 [Tilletiaria anomala UBC 951]
MPFLSAPLRWPEALTHHWDNPLFDLIERYRDEIPSEHLRSLPAPVLLILPVLFAILLAAVLSAAFRPTSYKVRIAVEARKGRKEKRTTGARTVLLLGSTESGKTSIFSAFVYGSVPKTHTSQHESEGHTILGPPPPLDGEKGTLAAPPSQSVPIHLIDLPGHPRLRVRANEFLPAADAIVYCVDATLAARAATASASQAAVEGLSDAIDFFHATLCALAAHRLKSTASKSAPPSLQILFTRSDLSPLLAGATSTDAAQLAKRKAQLLQRAKAGFEAELARRRAALQIGRRGAGGAPRVTKIGGIGEVQGDGSVGSSGAGGLLARLMALLGLRSGVSSRGEKSGLGDDEEHEEEEFDYVDWAMLQRQSQGSTSLSAVGSFSLDKLDEEVVEGGKAQWGLNSLGKERDWLGGSGMIKEGKDDRDLRAFLTSL